MCPDPANKIRTEPDLSINTLASNFFGLKLSYKFSLDDNGVTYVWSHPNLKPIQTTIYNELNGCNNKNENGFDVTCLKCTSGKSTIIITSLTVRLSLDTNVTFAVSGATKLDDVDFMIKGMLSIICGLFM